MPPRVCESCGEPIVAGVQFCTNCGSFLGWTDPDDPATDEAVSGEAATATTAPAPVRPAPVGRAAADVEEDTAEVPVEAVATPTATGSVLRAVPAPRTRTREPAGTPCRRCATPNPSTRRFCAKCGLFIGAPSDAEQLRAFAAPKRRWWQRWLHGRPGSERAARSAYRKSLPWTVRLRRVFVVLAVLALCFAYLRFVGRDPVSWAKNRLDTLRGSLVAVPDLSARSPNPADVVPGYPAKAAIDGRSDTAWATRFSGPTKVPGTACTAVADTTGLLLTTSGDHTVRAVKIHAGFPDKNTKLRWRPKTLELWFPDGQCQRVSLADSPKPQQVSIDPVDTNAVRVAVVAGYPPQGGSTAPATAITEIALLMRPN